MEEEKIENTDLLNGEEDENSQEEETQEDVETLKQKNQSLYEQLKKAKGFERDENGQWVKKQKPEVVEKKTEKAESNAQISPKELYALGQANVHIDDFDDVVDYAKFKKVDIATVLKDDVLKTILAKKSEYRKSAEIANTAPARKGATKVSDDALLSDLSEGKIPAKDSEEAERLFWARRGGKR